MESLSEERFYLVERNCFQVVVQVGVVRAGYDQQLLVAAFQPLEGVFPEIT